MGFKRPIKFASVPRPLLTRMLGPRQPKRGWRDTVRYPLGEDQAGEQLTLKTL